MNGARYFLPHILALSTNSPFWEGMDTGFKSYRCKVFERFPRTNIPDIYSSWSAGLANYVNLLIHTNCIDNAKKIWWDIRPHPHFPTLEFRVCDVPMRVEETIAIAALCQAVIAKLFLLHEKNQSFRHYSRALIMENKWRAARYGLDGKMIDFGKQTEVPVRSLVDEILDFVSDVVPGLDSADELAYIQRMVEEGTGADRQLKVFAETGDLKAVVDYMIQQTEQGLFQAIGEKPSRGKRMTDAKNLLRLTAFDSELRPGARNAVRSCLRIQPEEKVTLITDRACLEIGASLVHELEAGGAPCDAWVLEELAPRPLTDMPRAILEDMESSAISIFAVKAQQNEAPHSYADDRRRQPPQNAARPYGQHR